MVFTRFGKPTAKVPISSQLCHESSRVDWDNFEVVDILLFHK